MQPELFYISPQWDEQGCLSQHEIAVNTFDSEDNVAQLPALSAPRTASETWKPIQAIRVLIAEADFYTFSRLTFALSLRALEAVRDLLSPSAEALPITITRENPAESFEFRKVHPPETLYLLHGIKNVPFRRGQNGYWSGRRYHMMDSSYRVLSGTLPWLDPEEFTGMHLFQIMGEWVASKTFVERVRERNLTGLQFFPIDYEAKPRPPIPKPKKILPPPPEPDFALGKQGFTPALREQWIRLWDWTVAALRNRSWKSRKPKIAPPLPKDKLREFEGKHGIRVPIEYATVLTEFTAKVSVHLGVVAPEDTHYAAWEELQLRLPIMFGGTQTLWDFEKMARHFPGIVKYANEIAKVQPGERFGEILTNKLPILEIANGDYLALDLTTSEVVYLSHDDAGERIHGRVLAANFTDFVTRWSWTCFSAPDFMPLECFYNQDTGDFGGPSFAMRLWHEWLRGASLPEEP